MADSESELKNQIVALKEELVSMRREAELTRSYTDVTLRAKSILLNVLPACIVSVDWDGLVTEWNSVSEQMFGLSWKDTVGRPLEQCDIGWDWPTIIAGVKECQEKQIQLSLPDLTVSRDDKAPVILAVTLTPLGEAQKDEASLLLLASDVTERRALEEHLNHTRKLESIGQLAAGIAHEMNTPLQYIGDNTRFLERGFRDISSIFDTLKSLSTSIPDSSQREMVVAELLALREKVDTDYLSQEIPAAISEALGGITHVTRLVTALKEFSHPGKSEQVMVDIHRALDNTLVVAANEIKHVADVVKDFHPAPLAVLCMPGELNQVFLNILINAAHAIADTPSYKKGVKGSITVRTRRLPNAAEISISDTGTGIPAQIQAKIFDPFFTTKDVGKGTGQGLALAYTSIVKKHGGNITFDTEPGKGTTFYVHLPIPSTVE